MTPEIVRTPHGFELRAGGTQLYGIRWSDVERITAYKADLLTMDTVCLELEAGDDVVCTVDEETEGFWALIGPATRVQIGR